MKRLAMVSALGLSLLLVPSISSAVVIDTCSEELIVFVCAPQNGVVKVASKSESNTNYVAVGGNCAEEAADLLGYGWELVGGDPESTPLGKLVFTFRRCAYDNNV
jgi:hypothetical protein